MRCQGFEASKRIVDGFARTVMLPTGQRATETEKTQHVRGFANIPDKKMTPQERDGLNGGALHLQPDFTRVIDSWFMGREYFIANT